MNTRASEVAVIASGVAYLLVLGWAIGNTSYDLWGALVVVPIYGLLGLVIVRRMFQGEFSGLAKPMAWGLLFKLAGTLARYWVGFGAYGGAIDASRYHDVGAEAASKVWSGQENIVTVLPQGQGTEFTQNFTAFVYTLTGPSQMAGFVTFSLLAFIGVAFMVKAAAIAVPGLAATRYAWLCMVFPSVVYWPSSIGKEAAIMFGLGLATYGIARVLTNGRWVASLPLIVAGLGFVALVRPHMAGIWVAGALPALVIAFVRRPSAAAESGGMARRTGAQRFGIVVVLAAAAIGLTVLSSITVRFLSPDSEETSASVDSLNQILESTTARTAKGGSNFTPPSVASPLNWPYASIRTLLRPLPIEAEGLAQIVAAAEIMALLILLFLARRRLYNLPRLVVTSPYVTFVVVTLFITGLTYASFANLGLLTRQKSLAFPLLLLLPCLPLPSVRRPNADLESAVTAAAPSSMDASGASPHRSADPVPPTARVPAVAPRTRRPVDDLWTRAR